MEFDNKVIQYTNSKTCSQLDVLNHDSSTTGKTIIVTDSKTGRFKISHVVTMVFLSTCILLCCHPEDAVLDAAYFYRRQENLQMIPMNELES